MQTDSDLSSLNVEKRGKSNLLLLIIAAVIVAAVAVVLP
jgi:hypothetical protein